MSGHHKNDQEQCFDEGNKTTIRIASRLVPALDAKEQENRSPQRSTQDSILDADSNLGSHICSFCAHWIGNGANWVGLQNNIAEFESARQEWKKRLDNVRTPNCPFCRLVTFALPRNDNLNDPGAKMFKDFNFGVGRDHTNWAITDPSTGRLFARMVQF